MEWFVKLILANALFWFVFAMGYYFGVYRERSRPR
jgi:hypothetical protein